MSSTPRRDLQAASSTSSTSLLDRMRGVERRDWWLGSCAVLITLVLTIPPLRPASSNPFSLKEKAKGAGLGLSMVYGIVKQSNGYIEVSSEVGIGTSFEIYLPQVDDAIDTATTTVTSGSLRGSETILLVEDDPSLRVLAVHMLESFGYSVLEARSGGEALEICRQREGHIHLLLTDVVMPGMSGRVLAEQLLPQRPQLQVVYMSGCSGQTVGAHGVLVEGSYFLPKPFTREALAQKIREVLDRKMRALAH